MGSASLGPENSVNICALKIHITTYYPHCARVVANASQPAQSTAGIPTWVLVMICLQVHSRYTAPISWIPVNHDMIPNVAYDSRKSHHFTTNDGQVV